jgi:phosphomannomutase
VIKLVGEALAEDETQTISSLIDYYRRYAKLEECNLRVHDTDAVFSALRDRYGDALILELDGLSFDCGTYWFNVRRSNTEEKIRINLEAKNRDTAEQALQSVVRFIKSV